MNETNLMRINSAMYSFDENIFVSRENRPILVIDVERDVTIQKMISDATSKSIESHIELELGDIETILKADGLTTSLSSSVIGDNAHKKSLQPLIQHYKDCKTVKAILISFTLHETFPIIEIKEAINELAEIFTKEEDILFSILIDNRFAVDAVQTNSIIKLNT